MSSSNWSTSHFSFPVPNMGDMIQRYYPFISTRPFPLTFLLQIERKRRSVGSSCDVICVFKYAAAWIIKGFMSSWLPSQQGYTNVCV